MQPTLSTHQAMGRTQLQGLTIVLVKQTEIRKFNEVMMTPKKKIDLRVFVNVQEN